MTSDADRRPDPTPINSYRAHLRPNCGLEAAARHGVSQSFDCIGIVSPWPRRGGPCINDLERGQVEDIVHVVSHYRMSEEFEYLGVSRMGAWQCENHWAAEEAKCWLVPVDPKHVRSGYSVSDHATAWRQLGLR